LRRQTYGEQSVEAAAALRDLGRMYYSRNDYDAARRVSREALTIYQAAHVSQRKEMAETQQVLAQALIPLDKLSEAETLLQEALATYRGLHSSPDKSVAVCLHDLASVYHAQGKYTNAEPLFREALSILDANQDTGDVEYPRTLLNLGMCLVELGRN